MSCSKKSYLSERNCDFSNRNSSLVSRNWSSARRSTFPRILNNGGLEESLNCKVVNKSLTISVNSSNIIDNHRIPSDAVEENIPNNVVFSHSEVKGKYSVEKPNSSKHNGQSCTRTNKLIVTKSVSRLPTLSGPPKKLPNRVVPTHSSNLSMKLMSTSKILKGSH